MTCEDPLGRKERRGLAAKGDSASGLGFALERGLPGRAKEELGQEVVWP